MSDWFFTSDLHGQTALYEQLLALAATRYPRAVILGGDLAPHALGAEGVRLQRVFFQGFLVEFARRLREASPDTELVVLMGNDDWSSNLDCLEAEHGRLWLSVHGRIVTVDGRSVAGLAWVPITPFTIKDWERWDDGDDEQPARLAGVVSKGLDVESHTFDPAVRRPSIAEAIEELFPDGQGGDTIVVSHSPPRDTRCDMTNARVHVGSRALRRFVEHRQPPLVLSGHIHESPRVSTSYRDAIGATIVVNPGQFGTSRLCGVWFDPSRLHDTLRHTVHG